MNSVNKNNPPLVLIVEDDQATGSIFNIWLRNLCSVLVAMNGEQALQILKILTLEGRTIDLFVFDISLPYPWSGITLKAEIIERWPHYSSTPFIAETAFAMPHDRQAILDSGFAAYLTKPLERGLLVETVSRYL